MSAASELDLDIIPLEEILKAREVLEGRVTRTPLIPLHSSHARSQGKQIYLKLENLQPVRSFKLRGACNAIHQLTKDQLTDGIFSCSAGNFAQGLAYNAHQMQLPCKIIVPDNAPKTKIDAITRLGGHVIPVPYATWWEVMTSHTYDGISGHFIHPVCNRHVIAGHGTMGLEILEDLPDVDTIISPYGGGGCVSGVASAVKAQKPDTRIMVCEVDTAAPLSAAVRAGHPVPVEDYKSSFVDGMGGHSVLTPMWRLVRSLVDDVMTLSLRQVCDAVTLLVEQCSVVAEGAGAAPLAAALTDRVPPGNIVCVVSGGNIDTHKLVTILQGGIPD